VAWMCKALAPKLKHFVADFLKTAIH